MSHYVRDSRERLYDPPVYPPYSNSSVNVQTTKPPGAPRPPRTPSPTPSEVDALNQKGLFNIRSQFKKSVAGKSTSQKFFIYALLGVLLVIAILLAVFQKQIIDWLQPGANKIHNLTAGYLIPVGILAIMSFPPFVGHEIVIILVGVVWGLWVGFAIAAAGTLLGEIANFFVFKYWCSARGQKYERTNIDYACLARIVREGGLKVAVIARYSFVPPHYTTAVFASVGMPFWVFFTSAILSLPRHFATVYIGVAIEDESKDGSTSSHQKLVNFVLLAVTILAGVVAMRYINHLGNKIKPDIIYQRRKARQAKEGLSPFPSSSTFSGETSRSQTPTPRTLEAGQGAGAGAPPYAAPPYYSNNNLLAPMPTRGTFQTGAGRGGY